MLPGSKGGASLSNSNGFTLVEILVVFAILAMLVPVFLLIVTHTVNLNNDARLRSGAILLAEGLVEEMLANSRSIPAEGEQPPYLWQYENGEGVHDSLEEIAIRVTWEYRRQVYEVRLVTYRQRLVAP